jgi:hypothetical protein
MGDEADISAENPVDAVGVPRAVLGGKGFGDLPCVLVESSTEITKSLP